MSILEKYASKHSIDYNICCRQINRKDIKKDQIVNKKNYRAVVNLEVFGLKQLSINSKDNETV
jgi:hypothetical protein